MKYEEEIQDSVVSYLRRRRFNIYLQVPFLSGKIDLLGYHAETQIIVAIELKKNNWRQALKQAISYRMGANYSFIAMPSNIANNLLKKSEILRYFGIGLIGIEIGERLEELIHPIRKENGHSNLRKELLNALQIHEERRKRRYRGGN